MNLHRTHPMFFVVVLGDLLLWFGCGLTLVFAPTKWISSPNFDVTRAFMSMRLWGVVFLVLGLMTFYGLVRSWRWARLAFVIGAAVLAGWATSFAILAVQGKNTGVTGVFLTAALAINVFAQSGEPTINPMSANGRHS